MSTSFSETPAFPIHPSTARSGALHQRNSWGLFAAAWRIIDGWSERRSQRLTLRDLSEQQLDDIGLTRMQALHEVAKPFWKK
jgi:uncharacterized protein YjiS (DUF1127 family)